MRITTTTKAYLALASICLIWGTTYLALRVGVVSFPAFLFSGIRQAVAGIVVTGYFLLKGEKWPRLAELKYHVLAGVLMVTLGNGVVAWAEKFIPSGIAALICSLMPVWVILINLTFSNREKSNTYINTGVAMGFLGLAIIFRDNLMDFSNPAYLWGIVITFFASLSWAAGTLVHKHKNHAFHPIYAAGLQMLFGGAVMLLCSPVLDDYSHFTIETDALVALAYLTVFGSIFAYSAYAYALNHLPTSLVAMYAYVNPIVAVVLGWLWLDEKLNGIMVLACIITVAGVYLVNLGNKKKKRIE